MDFAKLPYGTCFLKVLHGEVIMRMSWKTRTVPPALLLLLIFSVGCINYGPTDQELLEESNESTIQGCQDIDLTKYGQPVEAETLVCDGMEMFWGSGDYTNILFDSWNYTVISDPNTMDDISSGFETPTTCEIDFDTHMVPAVWDYRESTNCADIEICGLADDGEKTNVVVYIHQCTGLDDSSDFATPFHMVKTPKTDKKLVFNFLKHTENY